MKIKKIVFFMFMMFLPFLIVDAMSITRNETTDRSTWDPWSESTIVELYDNTNEYRIYCLDHGLTVCTDCSYYYVKTIYEGPACGLVYYPSSSSGTTNYHNRIKYIQYYSGSSFKCKSYKYESGLCDSNNKNAVDDENASISVVQSSKTVLKGNYYVAKLNVTMNGSVTKYVPTVSNSISGLIITTEEDSTTDVTGTEITATSIYLKVPKSNVSALQNVTLTVKGSYTTECVYLVPYLTVYSTGYSNYQRISYANWYKDSATSDFSKSSSVNVEIESTVGTIKIIKLDQLTNKPLEGVTFKLYTQNNEEAKYVDGTLVGELTTDKNGIITASNLAYGSYLLREVSTLEEYVKQSEDALVILNKNTVEITITNDPIVIKISKLDLTSHNEVEGATIVIKDSSGDIIQKWVSTKEVKQFYIAPGKYSLEETVAPNGYDKINTIFQFIVHEDGTIELLDDQNKYLVLEEDTLILYNEIEEVIVPDTADSMNYVLIGVGVLSIGFGAYFVYKGRKKINNSL